MPKRKPKDPERSPDLPHNWIERHIQRLEAYVYYEPIDLTSWQIRQAVYHGPGNYEFIDADWREIALGESWGGPDITAFFHTSLTVPESHSGTNTVLDLFLDGGEAQISINGRPWQGLDWNRSIVPLEELAVAGHELELDIEAFIINYPYDDRRNDEREAHCFERARLLKRDAEIEAFVYDARFVLDTYLSYWKSDQDYEVEEFLLHHLETACRAIGPRVESREEARRAAKEARSILQEKVFASRAYQKAGLVNICAHSHLDIVYLWPIRETFRKNCRTVTNMLSLMREYPEYRFSYSQPYLYEKLKELYPQVFEEVKQRVKEGRWEVIGAMYVEPDGNLLGTESLIRQILFGKRFLKDEMGVDTATCWLPDVFGVMYSLPQILKKSGVKYFSTVKLNIWNDTNDFPHDSFRWRGPDGSEVLAHFPPTHFGQKYDPDTLRRHWNDFAEKNTVGENLYVYGYADGGGGPTREMVEASLRTKHFPGLPDGRIEFVEEFFHRLEARSGQLAVWDDELYLEAHRGTYTTKGDLKRLNRKAELFYRDIEVISSIAWLYGGPRIQERLNAGWKLILLNQFHDTLPGTHSPEGVPDIKKDYETIFEIGQEIKTEIIDYLSSRIDRTSGPEAPSELGAGQREWLLFNTLSWERSDVVELPLDSLPVSGAKESAGIMQLADGRQLPYQLYGEKLWCSAHRLPPLGWETALISEGSVRSSEKTAELHGSSIKTPFYLIELDEEGALSRLYDICNEHEVLSAPGNQFQVYEDDPGYKFSSWDLAYHFEEYCYPVKQQEQWRCVSNGPVCAVFYASWKVLDSHIEQEMWLYAHSPRIDFKTKVWWNNKRKLLKVAFPLEIRARRATYDLPFANIERPTHRNTSWDQAKFEVSGHKWADVSEGDYGVALLNDCKYGYDIKDNLMRLSLLRSPVRPDSQSDQGFHRFTYALLPHRGNWVAGGVDRHGYELNIPVLAAALASESRTGDEQIPSKGSFAVSDSPHIIVEALKQAETGDGLILRSFDSHATHSRVNFRFERTLRKVAETDLLEENPSDCELAEAHHLTVRYSPYEIKTHRLDFSR